MKQRILFSLFAIGLMFALIFPVRAQQTSYDGLDIVFLVDQSSSMGRIMGGGMPNDKLGLRFYSLLYSTSLMGDFRLLINKDATFRVGVINFGNVAEAWDFAAPGSQSLYWQTIAPQSRDDWKPQYAQLEREFKEMETEFSKRDLGETNFQVAFEAAHSLFNQVPDLPGRRLRVVILLTDGQPSMDTPGFSVPGHMTGLSSYAQRYFSEPDYRIYTVGMINSTDVYWQTVKAYWEKITNDPCTDQACTEPARDRSSLVASNDDVGKRFQEILRDLTSELPVPDDVKIIDQAVVPGPLVVPPYLKSISFAYFKTDPSQQLLLTNSMGSIDAGMQGVEVEGVDGPIQIVRISNPLPGRWQVATDPAGVDVDITMRYIFAQSRLDSPSGMQVQFVPLTVQYALLDDLGQPLPVYSDLRYRLLVKAEVTAGGESWDLTLNSNADNTYSAEFIPILTGTHIITVRAESQDFDGSPVIVFDGEIGAFDVSPVMLIPSNLPLSWPQFSEQPIIFELQDARGFPVKAPSSLNLVVTVLGENAPPLSLRLQPDGTYEALYTPSMIGLHTVHVLASVLDSSGMEQVILDSNIGEFEVSPTIRVDLNVQKPDQPEQYDTGLWPFQRIPLVLQVQLQDENGHILNPQQIFMNNAVDGLSVIRIQDSKGNDLALSLQFQQTPQTGIYMAESSDFGRGDYVITVEGPELKSGYVYQNKQTQIFVRRIRHPLHIPLLITGIVFLAAVISASSWMAVRNYNLRKYPCKGMIYIVDAYGTPKFQKRLDTYGKNTITISGKEISPLTHVKKMQFWCESDAQSRDGRVYARVWLDNDRTPVSSINGKIIGSNSEVKIGKYAFWLLKDPEEMPDHPEAQEQEAFS